MHYKEKKKERKEGRKVENEKVKNEGWIERKERK